MFNLEMSRQLYLAKTSDDSLFDASRKDNSELDLQLKLSKLKKFKEPGTLNDGAKQEIENHRVTTLSISTTI